MQVTLQTNGSDCGIYAIAFATALCLGQSPGLLQFDESRMISHLAKCLEQGTFTMFPVCQTRRQIQIKATCVLDVYCACRMPSLPDTDMIECTSCKKCFMCCVCHQVLQFLNVHLYLGFVIVVIRMYMLLPASEGPWS